MSGGSVDSTLNTSRSPPAEELVLLELVVVVVVAAGDVVGVLLSSC